MSAGNTTGHPALARNSTLPTVTDAINRLLRGQINCTVPAFTLNPNATSTTLTDPRLSPDSHIDFKPVTADAAAAKPSIYVTSQTNGSATINHASSASADQTFSVLIIG